MPLALDDPLIPAQPGARRSRDSLQISVPISRFRRLAAIAENPDDELDIDVTVEDSREGLPLVSGRITGQVGLACQRCLGLQMQSVDVELKLAIVGHDSEFAAPPEFEAWETGDGAVVRPKLGEVIEDEVILALPLIARHEDEADCGQLPVAFGEAGSATAETEPDGEEGGKTNPFAVLKELKGLKRSD